MKILAIGHICLDVIHLPDRPEIRGYGGIYYTLATLASLCTAQDTVIPVFGVNQEDYEPLMQHLAKYPTIDTSGIFTFPEPTNTVHLFYKDDSARIECSKNIAQPIPFDRIRRFLGVNGVLINMISGFDLSLDTLDQIRIAIRPHGIPLHLDYHSLTLGINSRYERFRRPVEEWRRWGFMVDTIQLNEDEIGGLSVEFLSEQQVAGHLLTLGVKGVLVTRGEQGVTAYYNDHKHVARKDIEGIHVEEPRDATGCGDVFGAAFHYHYVKTGDFLGSADVANRIAATKVGLAGSETLHLLKAAYADETTWARREQ